MYVWFDWNYNNNNEHGNSKNPLNIKVSEILPFPSLHTFYTLIHFWLEYDANVTDCEWGPDRRGWNS